MMYSNNTIAVPPGATIREQLENRGMKQKEFASRMGLSEKHISRLINGQVELTQEVALRLESVLGVPAGFWNNLEAIYREKLARVIAENELAQDVELAEKFPYAKIAALGWVAATRKAEEKAIHLRAFFEVAKLELLENLRIPGIVYRKAGANEASDYSLAIWAQKARIEARQYETAAINISKLELELPRIREMTRTTPDVFCSELINLFTQCGVALVLLPHIGGSFLDGATFYDGNRIVMGLTVRGKDADKFWFSLFHEVGHIVLGHIGALEEDKQQQEIAANVFAANMLIPPELYQEFTDSHEFTEDSILAFAQKIEIAPGVVLGRLQKEGYVPYNKMNTLKAKYEIV